MVGSFSTPLEIWHNGLSQTGRRQYSRQSQFLFKALLKIWYHDLFEAERRHDAIQPALQPTHHPHSSPSTLSQSSSQNLASRPLPNRNRTRRRPTVPPITLISPRQSPPASNVCGHLAIDGHVERTQVPLKKILPSWELRMKPGMARSSQAGGRSVSMPHGSRMFDGCQFPTQRGTSRADAPLGNVQYFET
ncbi:hypothetical protein BKA80DRAFT_68333 [Phyllosticta citrichinensis]